MLSEGNDIDLMYRAGRRLTLRARELMGLIVKFASLKSLISCYYEKYKKLSYLLQISTATVV
jgi:hypothetical protein